MFTDTAFVNHQTHDQMIAGAKAKGFHDLAEDLEREYYITLPALDHMFVNNGFSVSFG